MALYLGGRKFPGVVKEVVDNKSAIEFLDGDHSWVSFGDLAPIPKIGDLVLCLWRKSYYPAIVPGVHKTDDSNMPTFDVQYLDDGVQKKQIKLLNLCIQ